MEAASSTQGWYPSPENPGLVRYWDGEMWTDSTRPARDSVVSAAVFGGPDHFVQHSPQVSAELRLRRLTPRAKPARPLGPRHASGWPTKSASSAHFSTKAY